VPFLAIFSVLELSTNPARRETPQNAGEVSKYVFSIPLRDVRFGYSPRDCVGVACGNASALVGKCKTEVVHTLTACRCENSDF
jgi:hypothetical protein